MCICEESPFGRVFCVPLYLFVGFAVFAVILAPMGIFIVATLVHIESLIGGLINKYKQPGAIYIDSLTKKDETVINMNSQTSVKEEQVDTIYIDSLT
jgi:uncharacterized membrane protein